MLKKIFLKYFLPHFSFNHAPFRVLELKNFKKTSEIYLTLFKEKIYFQYPREKHGFFRKFIAESEAKI